MKIVFDLTVFGWCLMVIRNSEPRPLTFDRAFPAGRVLMFRRTEIIVCRSSTA